MIDIKNAFSSEAIAESLHRMRVPDYLCRILKSYFQNRVLIYETSVGRKLVNITVGVPQGPILGRTFWNGVYNGVLTLNLPNGIVIVGSADDIVSSVKGKTLEEVQMLMTESIGIIENLMQGTKLQIVHHKKEVLIISNCKAVQQAEIVIGGLAIASMRVLKCLGVVIDDSHVDYPCKSHQCGSQNHAE